MFVRSRVLIFERRPGRILLMRGLRAGREAQAIATLISIPDQMAQLTPSTKND
jgi:hypothetical protein